MPVFSVFAVIPAFTVMPVFAVVPCRVCMPLLAVFLVFAVTHCVCSDTSGTSVYSDAGVGSYFSLLQ